MRGSSMRESYRISVSAVLLGAAVLIGAAAPARAQYLGREQDIGDLRLGQRVLVDDGTCPAGQVKQVTGSTPGNPRIKECVPMPQG